MFSSIQEKRRTFLQPSIHQSTPTWVSQEEVATKILVVLVTATKLSHPEVSRVKRDMNGEGLTT
jgi:hypothetical protein